MSRCLGLVSRPPQRKSYFASIIMSMIWLMSLVDALQCDISSSMAELTVSS